MRPRPFVILVCGAIVATWAVASVDRSAADPVYEWAIVQFSEPVKVLDKILTGRYVIEHDVDRMRMGGPCTSIYEHTASGRGKLVVSFHCRPTQRPVADRLIVTVRRRPDLGRGYALTEYQFPGSGEGHLVPGIR